MACAVQSNVNGSLEIHMYLLPTSQNSPGLLKRAKGNVFLCLFADKDLVF